MNQPFLLCPANVSRHKNHEVLLEGFARADLGWPLVLTGVGTDLKDDNGGTRHPFLRSLAVALGRRPPTRAATLRRLIRQLHLVLGTSLLPVGYLSDSSYDLVLGRAAAVVLATLGEGGGSFPAEEAVLRGIPAICSDIPVLREHMARLGASVQWFDPTNPTALASRLVDLRDNYAERKAAAIAQVPGLTPRAWNQVALDYLAMFRNAGSARGPAR
jgi:glycosyltransferase involved in cell wall biosynthesis